MLPALFIDPPLAALQPVDPRAATVLPGADFHTILIGLRQSHGMQPVPDGVPMAPRTEPDTKPVEGAQTAEIPVDTEVSADSPPLPAPAEVQTPDTVLPDPVIADVSVWPSALDQGLVVLATLPELPDRLPLITDVPQPDPARPPTEAHALAPAPTPEPAPVIATATPTVEPRKPAPPTLQQTMVEARWLARPVSVELTRPAAGIGVAPEYAERPPTISPLPLSPVTEAAALPNFTPQPGTPIAGDPAPPTPEASQSLAPMQLGKRPFAAPAPERAALPPSPPLRQDQPAQLPQLGAAPPPDAPAPLAPMQTGSTPPLTLPTAPLQSMPAPKPHSPAGPIVTLAAAPPAPVGQGLVQPFAIPAPAINRPIVDKAPPVRIVTPAEPLKSVVPAPVELPRVAVAPAVTAVLGTPKPAPPDQSPRIAGPLAHPDVPPMPNLAPQQERSQPGTPLRIDPALRAASVTTPQAAPIARPVQTDDGASPLPLAPTGPSPRQDPALAPASPLPVQAVQPPLRQEARARTEHPRAVVASAPVHHRPARIDQPEPHAVTQPAPADSLPAQTELPAVKLAPEPAMTERQASDSLNPEGGTRDALRPEALRPSSPQPEPARTDPARLETAQQIARQIGDRIPPAESPGFDLALDPEELGKVRLKLVTQDGTSVLTIHAERPETLDLMRRHVATLEQDLRAQGHESLTLRFSGGSGQGSGQEQSGNSRTPFEDARTGSNLRIPDTPLPEGKSAPRSGPRDHLDLRL